jgi:hypothetical protein
VPWQKVNFRDYPDPTRAEEVILASFAGVPGRRTSNLPLPPKTLWAFAQVDHSDNLECGKNLVFVEFTAGMMIAVTCPFTTGRCEYQSAMSRRMRRCGGGSHF